MRDFSEHHAYLIIGDKLTILSEVNNWADELVGTKQVSSDKMIWAEPSLNVENSRQIKEWQMRRAQGAVKVGIVACENLSPAAGEALLKVFEEPLPGVKFFIIVPSESLLPPTLLSRLFKLEGIKSNDGIGIEASKFLTDTPVNRLKRVEKLVDHNSARQLVGLLEQELLTKRQVLPTNIFVTAGEVLQEANFNLNNQRLPLKTTLETVALSLPQIVL